MAAPMCRGLRRLPGKTSLNSLFCQRPCLTPLGHKYMRKFADFNKSNYSRKFTIATVSVSLASVFVVSCLHKTDNDKTLESRNKESKNEVQETEKTQSIISKDKITRNVKGVTDLKGYKITLYQFQSCPFCCKVRAALDFYGFSYDVIEVNSINKAQLKWSDYKKVPVMLLERTTGNDYLKVVDSTQITSVLGSYMLNPDQPVEQLVNSYPAILDTEKKKKTYYFPNKYFLMFGENKNDNCTVKEKRQEDKWRRWVDETFIHVISPTVYNTYAEARETFKHFSKVGEWDKHFSDVQRYTMIEVGSIAMYFVARMLKKKHNIKENPMDSMSDACQQWLRGLGKQKYMGGNQPNLADLKVVDSTQITSVLGSYMLNPDQPVEQLVNSYPAILDTEKKKKTYYFPNKYFLMFGENKNDNCTVKEKRQEDKWRRWVDETFIHVISPTVYNTYAEARETFKHFSKVGEWDKHFSDVQRYTMIEVGSIAMYFVARMLKKKHNIKENPMDSMSDACQQWLRGLGKQKYMGGNQPNLADLAMYGGLHSFKGCKAFREIMEMSKLQKWYNRMESDIAYHRGIEIAAWRATDKVDQ